MGRAGALRVVRRAHRRRRVRLLPSGRAGHRSPAGALHGRAAPMSDRPFQPGEPVLLVDRKKRRYLIDLTEGREFHTHTGVLSHDDIIGASEGSSLSSSRGAKFLALRPTMADGGAEDAEGGPGHIPQRHRPDTRAGRCVRRRPGAGGRSRVGGSVDGAAAGRSRCGGLRAARRLLCTCPGQRRPLLRRGGAGPLSHRVARRV